MEHLTNDYSKLVVVVVGGRSINTCRAILICMRVNSYARLSSLNYVLWKQVHPPKITNILLSTSFMLHDLYDCKRDYTDCKSEFTDCSFFCSYTHCKRTFIRDSVYSARSFFTIAIIAFTIVKIIICSPLPTALPHTKSSVGILSFRNFF